MAAHAHLKNGFTEDKKYHNLMTWLNVFIGVLCLCSHEATETILQMYMLTPDATVSNFVFNPTSHLPQIFFIVIFPFSGSPESQPNISKIRNK